MRCPECNKYASIDMADPEVEVESSLTNAEDDKIDGSHHSQVEVTGTARIALNCSTCATELKNAELEIGPETVLVQHTSECEEQEDYDATADVDNYDEFLPPNRKRQYHMYGVEGSIVVSCSSCGASAPPMDIKVGIKSSHMEDS